MWRDLAREWRRPGFLIPASCTAALMAAVLLAGHEPARTPPRMLAFAGLPVSGSAADSLRAGFDKCVYLDVIRVRCRRHEVMVLGEGPYEAALDLTGTDGAGGFDQLTLWSDRNQEAVYKLVEALQRVGWRHCETGDERWGDQDIYSREGAPVRVSMDLSYYDKRRVRLIPLWKKDERGCVPYH